MNLLFRKLVNKTDIFLVAFLFLEASTPRKKSEYVLYLMVCELVFQTLELAVMLALASCPGVKLLPAFLTCKFSGHMED